MKVRNTPFKIAIYLPSLDGGGAERSFLNLAKEFVKEDFDTDLVLARVAGPYLSEVPKKVRIMDLKSNKVLESLPKLVMYLRNNKPNVLISSLSHANIIAILAAKLSFVDTKVIVKEANTPSQEFKNARGFRAKIILFLMKLLYPHADVVVAVSKGVKKDLLDYIGLRDQKVRVIYNPIITDELIEKSKEPPDHEWFKEHRLPIIVSAGRLTMQKDFRTLIKAFALVRKEIDVRLIILGEGEERENLENLVKELGVSDYVWMPGFVNNPYKYIKNSSLFVLSSIYEGIANVLVEALACNVPVISTDCLSGPREILENGKYGKLVPIGDVKALTNAMVEALTNPQSTKPTKELLNKYYADKISGEYLRLI